MQISHETDHQQYSILSYAPGCLTIVQPWRAESPLSVEERRRHLTASCVLGKNLLDDQWPPQSFEQLSAEHFAALLRHEPELVVLGVGQRLRFPAPAFLAPLINKGIGVEVMDTAAACRTYNFLIVDGRKVVAALML